MLAPGGASNGSLHLLLLSTQFYTTHLHMNLQQDLTAGKAWLDICLGVRLVEERGREGERNIAFLSRLCITHGRRPEKWPHLRDVPGKALKTIYES